MTALVVALLALALAVALQRAMLRRHGTTLKAREQAFRFHAIRDELQLLAVREEVDQRSEIYTFLMWTANMAIRNAGVMRIRDLVSLARAVNQEIPPSFQQAIDQQPKALQRLVREAFEALAVMLIANDPLVRAGLRCAQWTVRTWAVIRPLHRSLVWIVEIIARQLAPSHAEAVHHARDYSSLAGRIAIA